MMHVIIFDWLGTTGCME